MSLTNYGEALALNSVLNNTDNRWCGLFVGAPGEAGGGTEISGGNYGRTAVTWAAAVEGAPSAKANSAPVQFPTATDDWAPDPTRATHWAIFDAPTGGNMIWYGTIKDVTGNVDTPREILNGDTFTFQTGALVCRMD